MILICGASGFVGRHLTSQLCHDGFAVRCLVRDESKAEHLEALGATLVRGDITRPETLEAALKGVITVINLVGIINETRENTFEKIHVEGTRNLVEAAKKTSVTNFIYVSALGTRENAPSRYHQSKYAAEQLVISSGLNYTIFRPGVMYGKGGEFIKMLRDLCRLPLIPVVGSWDNLMQPLYVGDLAKCISESLLLNDTDNKTWEIAGEEPMSYLEMLRIVAGAAGKPGVFIHLPLWLMRPAVSIMESVLSKPPLTEDQMLMLKEDNVCDVEELQSHFGINLVELDEWLEENLKNL